MTKVYPRRCKAANDEEEEEAGGKGGGEIYDNTVGEGEREKGREERRDRQKGTNRHLNDTQTNKQTD